MNARDFVLANNQICAVDGLARQLLLSKPSEWSGRAWYSQTNALGVYTTRGSG